MATLDHEDIRRHVQSALAEDIGTGDVTSLAAVPASLHVTASVVARQPLVVAGLEFAETAFRALNATIFLGRWTTDGERVDAGQVLLEVRGPAREILGAERVALNYLQKLSGIATLTSRYVDAVRGTRARILDTRKTTPGWRRFEKYAVVCGGGQNHRFGLYDRILLKDNHLAALRNEQPDPISAAIHRARRTYPDLTVEVEADDLDQVRQAADAGADVILLDNMSPENLRQAVAGVAGRARLEASGGITLETVRTVAESGVDFISIGAITHSAPAADIALDFGAPTGRRVSRESPALGKGRSSSA